MKYSLFLLVCACLWAAAATAQIDPNTDGVGIYVDLEGQVNEVELEVGVPMEVYLLLTRPSGTGGLAAWECELVVPENVTIWGWNTSVVDGAFCLSTPPGFVVAYPDGIPYQDVNLLMTFIIVPQDSEPAQFYITNYTGPNGQDEPVYLDLDEDRPSGDDRILINMTPYPGGEDLAAFTVNPDPTSVDLASWGGVKALYR